MKTWTTQIAEAAEKLNLAGVAHRFIRPETVVLSSRKDHQAYARLTAFDYATLYWDNDKRCTRALKGVSCSQSPLPLKLPEHLLSHLPPECFTKDGTYEGTHVDVWSVGVLLCQLLTASAPFDFSTTEANPSQQNVSYIAQWKSSEERRMVAEEFRTLLDDIFTEADCRITIGELAKDFRLTCTDRRELLKRKPTTYYRIDVSKVILSTNSP